MNRYLRYYSDFEPGMVVSYRWLPWLVESVDDVAPANWEDDWSASVEQDRKYRTSVRYPKQVILVPHPDMGPGLYAESLNRAGQLTSRGLRLPHTHHRGDFEVLDWPRAAVCKECGLLWPCPDERNARNLENVMWAATRPACDRCGRILEGAMRAEIGDDSEIDGPGKELFCGRKGACLNAARKAAEARGLVLVRDRWGWSWRAEPAPTVPDDCSTLTEDGGQSS